MPEQQGFLRGAPAPGNSLGALLVEGATGGGGPVDLSAASLAALETTTDPNTALRYSGGKTAVTARVTTSPTTIVTPPAGQRLRVVWVYAINDPDQSVTPAITVTLGGVPIYLGFAISHWESFTGPINGALTVALDSPGDVAFTAHYELVA